MVLVRVIILVTVDVFWNSRPTPPPCPHPPTHTHTRTHTHTHAGENDGNDAENNGAAVLYLLLSGMPSVTVGSTSTIALLLLRSYYLLGSACALLLLASIPSVACCIDCHSMHTFGEVRQRSARAFACMITIFAAGARGRIHTTENHRAWGGWGGGPACVNRMHC